MPRVSWIHFFGEFKTHWPAEVKAGREKQGHTKGRFSSSTNAF